VRRPSDKHQAPAPLWKWARWIFGVALGGGLLLVSSVSTHRAWKERSSDTDQTLFLRYIDQLEEVHHVLTEHPASPPWLPWLLGYRTPAEVQEEMAMAYRGAKAGKFLPPAAGQEPGDRDVVGPNDEPHPAFRRTLTVSILHLGLLVLALPFGFYALRKLLRRSDPDRSGLWERWTPGAGLTLAFWSMLLGDALAGGIMVALALLAPSLIEEPWIAWTGSVSYLALQGIPVLFCAVFLLPNWRHFSRVLGLQASRLFSPVTWALGFGLFGIDILLNLGLYEIEKLSGTTDTRDILTATLIDAPLPGLLSELFTAAVIAPVCEEIFFRGFLFNSLRGRMGTWGAALISSLIFGGLHYYSWFGMASIALFGMFTCWIYARTRSLWPGILLHGISNFLITLTTWYAYSEFPS